MREKFLPGLQHLQNPHPLVVHFPIALLYAAALLYFMAWIGRRDSWAWTGLWMLALGTLGAALAVGTGLWAAPGVMLARSVKSALLRPHKWIMIATLLLSAVLSAWAIVAQPIPQRGRIAFMTLLIVMVAVLTVGADYGGRMVYDYNAGGNACPQPIDFTQ